MRLRGALKRVRTSSCSWHVHPSLARFAWPFACVSSYAEVLASLMFWSLRMKSVSENGAIRLLGFHVGCSFQKVQNQVQNQVQFHIRAVVKNGWSISGPRLMTEKSRL